MLIITKIAKPISWVITFVVILSMVATWGIALIAGLFYFLNDERSHNPNPIILEFPSQFKLLSSSHIQLKSTQNLETHGDHPAVVLPALDVHFFSDYFHYGLYLLESSGPEAGKPLGVYQPPFEWGFRDIDIQGALVYAGMENGLKIVDISIPENPHPIGEFITPDRINLLSIDGDRAYLIDNQAGVYILDTSTPSQPKLIRYFKKLFDMEKINGMTVANNLVYLNDCSTITTIDFKDAAHPKQISSFRTRYGFCPQSPHQGKDKIVIIGDIAFMTEAYKASLDPVIVTHLSLLDVSNPAQPVYLGSFDWEEESSVGGKSLQRVILQTWNKVWLMDFSNPVVPVELGRFQIPIPNGYLQYFVEPGENDLIYVLDDENTLYTLEYSP